jgi:spore maturation protein SpmA
MLNYIWLGLIVCAVVIGGWNGHLKEVADSSLDMANTAVVGIAFTLIGVMALWLGIMRLAERSGLVSLLAWVLGPIMRWIFPEVPRGHPAMGSMLMNIAANLLGLNNAATPLGLRAMKDLDSLNKCPGTATNSMCTFLAINTSGIQLVPVTAIAIMVANKSANPTAIVGPSLLCSSCGAVAGVLMARFLSRLPMFRVELNGAVAGSGNQASAASAPDTPAVNEAVTLRPLAWWGIAIFMAFLLFFGFLFCRMVFPETVGLPPAADVKDNLFIRVLNAVSELSIPFLLSAIPLFAILRRVKVYEEFITGAKEGFEVAIKIIPYLVAMLVAISMFRAAGGIDLISRALAPVFNFLHFPLPPDLLPMVLIRPLSGSGSLGFFTELVKNFGPDSLIARTAGTIYGSTETTFYVLAVYFGSVAVTRTRHAVLAGLTADFVGMVVAVFLCRMMFG